MHSTLLIVGILSSVSSLLLMFPLRIPFQYPRVIYGGLGEFFWETLNETQLNTKVYDWKQ